MLGVGGFRKSVWADDAERVPVVTDETEQGVGLLDGEALVFLNSWQVAQVLQRQQHERIDAFGLQLAVLLHPFCCKTYLLIIVPYIVMTVDSVLQLRHKLVEFLARVPLFISFVVDDCYLHIFVGVLTSAKIQN